MDFEFDPEKSRTNILKHGIDFQAAKTLWLDERRVEIPARTEDEPRFILIARLLGKLWVAVYTPRGDKIRIISVRRAHPTEVKIYES